VIRVARETTGITGEHRLRLTIRLRDKAALRAGSGCVPGIDSDHGNPGQFSLVLNELSQLGKSPGMQDRSLAAPCRNPYANVCQFFQCNSASGALRSLYDLLRNNVVGVFSKTGFFARKFFESALGRFGSLGLELRPNATVAMPDTLNRIALINFTVRVHSDIGYTEINAKEVRDFTQWRFINITTLKQVEDAVTEDKITLTPKTFKEFGLSLTADKRHLLAACHCPDRNNTFIEFVGDKPVIERESAVWFESAHRLLIEFVGIIYLGKHPYSGIGAQSKQATNFVVFQFMKGVLAKYARVPCDSRHVITGCIRRLKRLLQGIKLLRRRLQLDLRYQLHTLIIPSIGGINKKDVYAVSSAS
jgi:hypothetical protein